MYVDQIPNFVPSKRILMIVYAKIGLVMTQKWPFSAKNPNSCYIEDF